ncbi:MAG: cell filamentation protein Fic [Micrococcales bacterium]|nr:cell filamentation protein Fic [Micrococcales bacterium]
MDWPDDFVDPYLDPTTGLLANKVGALTKVALDEAEGDLSFARLVQLVDRPPKATGDLAELRAIHQWLFQDVHEWAGQLRTVDLRKNVEGGEFREGNGRTQRVFWSRVARDAGWQLDWRAVHGSTNDEACRAAAVQRDFGRLHEMFDAIVTPAPPVRRDRVWREAEQVRLSFPRRGGLEDTGQP